MALMLKLINQHFETIELRRNITTEQTLELENRYDFYVKYSDDFKHCLATLICEVRSKDNPEVFYIKLVNVGEFECAGIESDDTKKEAHIECNKILFPYSQYMVSNLSVRAGLPPVFIENQFYTKDLISVNK